MMSDQMQDRLITNLNVRDYFQGSVETAVHNQQLQVNGETLLYVVNLLTEFTRADALYEDTPDGRMIKPLVGFYSDAVSAPSSRDALQSLKRLGDVALFIAGLFANSLQRSLVDVDYYIAMGGSAYDSLADGVQRSARARSFGNTYRELAEKFTGLVDVLAEVADEFQPGNDQDLLRLYELWLLTGSHRIERKLRQNGIQPITGGAGKVMH